MLRPFATASRRTPLFYIAIHMVSLLSHAACAIAIAIDVHNNDDDDDNNDNA